jgi:hypothetical protein
MDSDISRKRTADFDGENISKRVKDKNMFLALMKDPHSPSKNWKVIVVCHGLEDTRMKQSVYFPPQLKAVNYYASSGNKLKVADANNIATPEKLHSLGVPSLKGENYVSSPLTNLVKNTLMLICTDNTNLKITHMPSKDNSMMLHPIDFSFDTRSENRDFQKIYEAFFGIWICDPDGGKYPKRVFDTRKIEPTRLYSFDEIIEMCYRLLIGEGFNNQDTFELCALACRSSGPTDKIQTLELLDYQRKQRFDKLHTDNMDDYMAEMTGNMDELSGGMPSEVVALDIQPVSQKEIIEFSRLPTNGGKIRKIRKTRKTRKNKMKNKMKKRTKHNKKQIHKYTKKH